MAEKRGHSDDEWDSDSPFMQVGDATLLPQQQKRVAIARREETGESAHNNPMDLPYKSLSEGAKNRIRQAVRTGNPKSLSGVEAAWATKFLLQNAAKRGAPKRARRVGGARRTQPRKPRAKGSRRPPTLRTVARYSKNPGISMADPRAAAVAAGLARHALTPESASFLQAVGSPFTPLRDYPGGILPRRTDKLHQAASVAIMHESRLPVFASYDPATTLANGPGGALLFASPIPFGLCGLDVVGNQSTNGLTTGASYAAPTAITDVAINVYIVNQMLPRLAAGQQNFVKFQTQMADMQKWRNTGSGFKLHDVGPVLTRQGEFWAHEANYAKFYRSVAMQVSNLTASTANDSIKRMFLIKGMSGLMDYITSGAVFTATQADVRLILETARTQAVRNSEIAKDETPELGITIRYREPKADVDYFQYSPLVFQYVDGTNPYGASATTVLSKDAWEKRMSQIGQSAAVTYMLEFGAAAPANIVAFGSGSYFWYLYQTSTDAFLLTKDFLPIPYFELLMANYLGDQGNSLLILQPDNMQASGGVGRTLNAYRSTWIEMQVSGGSALFQTESPHDASYDNVLELANHMPVIVRGHSFFSNIWDGVSKAAKWVGRNAGSIINGVQMGAQVAKMVL